MSFRRRGLVPFVGLVLLAAGCGSPSAARNPGLAGPAQSTTSSSAAGPASGARCPVNAGFTGTVSDHGSAPVKGKQSNIEAGDFFFAPTCQTRAAASATLTLSVRNTGQALHNLSVPDQGVDTDVSAGQTITVTVKVGTAPLTFFCKYHRSSGMVGAIIPAGT